MTRKLIALIPTGGKTKEEIEETIDKAWPEIKKKLDAEKPHKKRLRKMLTNSSKEIHKETGLDKYLKESSLLGVEIENKTQPGQVVQIVGYPKPRK